MTTKKLSENSTSLPQHCQNKEEFLGQVISHKLLLMLLSVHVTNVQFLVILTGVQTSI